MITRKKLEKFVATRNRSEHQSNLQFQIDAEGCGFRLKDLPEVEKIGPGHYVWRTRFGDLIELGGRMSFEPKA